MDKWFKEAVKQGKTTNLGGWHKNQPPETRRRHALESRPKNWPLARRRLSAARALQALANVTKDTATKRAAEADEQYFRKARKLKIPRRSK